MDEGQEAPGQAVSSAPARPELPAAAGHATSARLDLLAFRRALDASTARAVVTPSIVILCTITYLVMAVHHVPLFWPTPAQMVDWGANDGVRLGLRREYWRLIASLFVHAGLIHLAVNMWSLTVIGPLVERIYGHLAFGVLYLASGVGGAIASAAVPPLRASVGASGAICGILGGLLAFLVVHRRAVPRTVFRYLGWNILGIVVFMAVLSLFVKNIDQAAHLGGLGVGFVVGWLLSGPWPVSDHGHGRLMLRRAVATVAIAAGLAWVSIVVADRDDATISPARCLEDFCEQLAPIIREFNAIRGELDRAIGPDDARIASTEHAGTLVTLKALSARAAANANRLAMIRTPRPSLLAIHESLARALADQWMRIEALSRYATTGEPEALEAAHQALAETLNATQDCERLRERYLVRHGLTPGEPPKRLDP